MCASFVAVFYFKNNKIVSQDTTYQTSRPKCPYWKSYTRTETSSKYINTTVGFSVQVPKGWYVAPENDKDPRVYNCDNVEGGPSFGIYPTYAGAYENYEKGMIKVEKKYTNIASGIIFIKEKTDDLDTAPWGFIYTVVSEKDKKVFNMIVAGNIEDSTVLPTLKLI